MAKPDIAPLRTFAQSPEAPFVIGTGRTDILADPEPWAERFAAERAIVCHDIFDAPLLRRLMAAARSTRFRRDDVPGLGTRQVEAPQRVGGILNLLLQRPALFRWIERVAGRAGIAGAEGRFHQTVAGAGDALAWHDDLIDPQRMLGITIGLTEAAYDGGQFELRPIGDAAGTRSFCHDRVGTALIFDIGRDIEHRLLPVSSGGPRRVFAGWFTRGAGL